MPVTRRTLRTARAIRVEIDREVEHAVADLVRAWGVAWDAVADEWRAAVAELVAAMQDGRWPSRAVILRSARVQRAMQITAAKIDELGKHVGVRVKQGLPDLLAAQECSHPCGKHLKGEGFDNIVVGSQFKAHYLVGGSIFGRKHKDRQPCIDGAQALQDCQPVQPGHHDVKNDKVRRVGARDR